MACQNKKKADIGKEIQLIIWWIAGYYGNDQVKKNR